MKNLLARTRNRSRVMLVVLLMMAGLGNGIAQTPSMGDYQSVNSGNWNDLATWQRYTSTGWETPTAEQGYPGQNIGTNDVSIRDGNTVIINVSPSQPIARLFIGGGTSGVLQYGATIACTLRVNGIVTINKNAVFSTSLTGAITGHRLVVERGIINKGTLNFSANDNRTGVGISFTGASSASFDCSEATLTNLRQTNGLVLDKGISSENVLWFTPGGTFQVLSGNTYGFLNIINGTFRLSGTNQFSNPVFSIASDTIFINGGFLLDNPKATIIGQYGTIRNRGKLTINSGTFNVGTGSGNCSVTNSTGTFTMTGGTMNISGRFTISGGDCFISGGTMNIATVGHADADAGAFHISQSADLTISGDPLFTFTTTNSNLTPYNDIEIISGTGLKTITGGTFQMGTDATPAGKTFLVNSDYPLYNFIVYNNTTKVSLTDNLTVNNQLTLNGQLLLNNQNLTMGASAPAIEGTLGSNDGMIVCNNGPMGGEVRKIVSNVGSYTFPIGENTGDAQYSPATLNFTSGTFASSAYAGVKVVNAKHPFNTNTTNYLNRYWNINTSGISNTTYDVNATYLPADVVGSDENISMGLNSSPWTKYGTVNSVTKELSAVGVTQTGSSIGFSGLMLAAATCEIEGATSVCTGRNYDYTVRTDGIEPTYSWEFVSNTSGATIVAGSTSQTVTVNPGTAAGSYQLRVNIIANDGTTPCTSSEVTVNPLPTLTTLRENVSCFGGNNGTMTATASNGTAPYSYVIAGPVVNTTGASTGVFTGLTFGEYTVTVTDANGCTATSSQTITQPTELTATGVQANAVSCFGESNGVATITPLGGTAPYTITPAQTGLSAGTHTFTITDANNCTLSVNVTITQPAQLTATGVQASAVRCFGGNDGAATITTSGGTSPYTITPATIGLSAGTHTFTITDANNCTLSVNVTITQPTQLTATGVQAKAVSCFGENDGAATITPYGGTAPYTITPAQTGLSAGTTTFTVTDANNCTTIVDVLITQPSLLTVTNSSNSPQCQGATLNLYSTPLGGTNGYTYSWTGPNSFTSTLQNPTRSNVRTTDAGTYTVTVTDANGCVATATTSVTINPAPSVSITASPGNSICSGNNVTFTAVASNAGNNPSFLWRINGDEVSGVTGSTFSSTILANAQQVTVVVTADPTYCSSTAISNIITMTVNSPVMPTVSVLESANNICAGTTVNFSAIVTNGGTSPIYQWLINGVIVPNVTGSSFSSSNLNNGDQVRVIVTSNATCVSPSTAQSSLITMFVNPVLTPSVSIAANPSTPVCPGTPVTFTASSTHGGSNPTYQWQVNGSPVGSNSSSFTSSTLSDGDIVRVRMTSNAACISPTFAISNEIRQTVNPGTPAIPGAIAGNALVCPNVSQTYSVAPVSNATSYQWTVPAGWSINGPSNTETITVTSGATGQNGSITVTASNSCGTSGARTLAVNVGTQSVAPTGITITNNNTCFGTSKILSVTGGSLGAGATWEWFTGSCGGTPVGTGASLTVNPAGTTIYYVRASGTCNTTLCAEGTVIVSPGAPAQPEPIAGGATPICPGNSLTYNIPVVANASSYNWTVPTGWTITAGQGTTSITVTAGTAGQNGNISVTAVNSCGNSTASTLAVTVAPGIPATPGSIIGNSDQCINSTGRVYSVAAVPNAISYTWVVPSGWTITSGQGTNSITVSTNGTASSGSISVVGVNTCGISAASVLPVYIVTAVPATPGAINGLTAICPVKSVVYSITPVQGAINYTWTVPGNWSISSGQGTASITAQVPTNAASGNVTVTAYNVCGNSAPSTLAVTVANTAWVNAGTDHVVCLGTPSITLNGSVGGAIKENQDKEWDWIAVSGGTFGNPASVSSVYNLPNNGNTAGTYIVRIQSNVNAVGCLQTQDEMTVTVLPNPTVSLSITGNNPICVGSSSTITFTGTPNTTVTYRINNGANQTLAIGASGTATLNTGILSTNVNYNLVSVIYTSGPACTRTITGSAAITVNPVATVTAGLDLTICAGTSAAMAGNFGGSATSATWTTSGTGSFSNNTPTAVYTPSAADVIAGTVTLTYTTNDPIAPCTAVSDAMILTINPVATVSAGADQTICAGNTVTMAGSFGGSATSGTWSGGTGSFSNNTPSAVYTPSAADIAAGTVTLTYTSNDPAGPCGAVSDAMVLTINPLTIVNAGADQSVCATSTVALAGTVSGPVAAGTWSGGSGSFSDPASLTTVYTPSAEEISDGTVTLTLTSADPVGPCSSVSDQITITITPTATVSAGVDQSICEGDVPNLRGTMGGAATAITWSGGAGSFSNPNSINTTYTPGATETGVVVLTLTSNDPTGSCDPVSDQMQVTIYPRATVNAGINQTICSNGTAQLSASIGGSATSGTWATSGGGTFSDPTSTTAVYTPGNSDIFNGTVTLTYTTNDSEGPCSAVSASITLTISDAVQITSQPINTGVCATYPADLSVQAVGDNQFYQWYRGMAPGGTLVVNSANITGAQSATLHFNNATSTDEGSYYVVISGAADCGEVTSNTVTLNVDQEITITSQFQSNTVCVGDDVTFNIVAEPGGLLNFQWRKDGVALTGQTTNTLSLENVTLTNAGSYDVLITGMAGYTCSSAVSAAATLTVTPSVEIPVFASGATSTRCQGGGNVTYSATANNTTGITYSLDNLSLAGGNTINVATGAVSYAATWSGTTTITATAAGCNGPATATHSVTVTPTVTIAPFAALTSTRCQGAGTVTYTTTATNNLSPIVYSLDPVTAAFAGNSINASTGAVTYAAGWSGTTTITATAAGCNGPATATHAVTVTPIVTIASFASLTSTRCQGAGTVSYSTTASNFASLTYSIDNLSLAGGNTINSSTGAVTFAAGWAGTTTITATAAGCNGPATATHAVTVTPTVTIASFANLTSTRCQGAGTVTYTTTAANNSLAIVYSLDNLSLTRGNTINAATGAVTYASTWAGTTTITATAAGCNGPVTATHTVTVTPTVTIASFGSPTSTRCQGAGTVTYSTTATNNSSAIVYSLDPTSAAFIGNSINTSTGAVTYAAGWSGTTTITATAEGCNGPARATHTVTVTPTVTIAPFAALTSTRCQGVGTTTYSTTATNSTGITYSLDAASIAGGNTINPSTGAVTYAAGWYNPTTITASAAGCNGPVTAIHTVTIDPTSVGGTLSPAMSTECTTTNNGTLTLSGVTGTILRWESSVNAGLTWTPIANTTTTHDFTNLPLTTIFRTVVKSGACPEAYSSLARVVVIPMFTPIISTTTFDLCNGDSTILTALTGGILQPIGAFTGGSFNQANPEGWRVTENGIVVGLPANADNTANGPWSETNGPRTFHGVTYDTNDNTKFAIARGSTNTTMETPVFNLFGLPSAELTFMQAYNLQPGTTARVELSMDGGNNYNTVLATYTGSTGGNIINPVELDMSNYIGMTNLRIRFNYISTTTSGWAVEGISIPTQQSDVTYTWSPTGSLNPPTGSPVTATPDSTTTYTLTMTISGCPATAQSIVITVANPPIVQTTNACIGGEPVTFTQTEGTLGGTWTVSGGGTIDAGTGVFTPSTPGCYTATYSTGAAICSDTKSFVVFPAAPLPVVNPACSEAIVLTPPPAISGFTLQYSYNDGATWDAITPPTADNCEGYRIRSRYITTLSCDTIVGSTTSILTGCAMSPAVTRVVDRTPPAITCPPTALGTTNENECYSTTVVLGTPTVTDNCSAATAITFSNNAPVQYPVGNTTVTWTATDACGNQSTCTQTVTVADNIQDPVFTFCPTDQVQTALPDSCSLSHVIIPDPVADDNCAVTRLTWTMRGATILDSPVDGMNYVSGETFNVGITTVTYTAYDAYGNQSQPCSFDVWIKDLNKPVFTVGCPEDVNQDVDAGLCTAEVTVPIPAVTDPCNEGYTLTNSMNGTNNASGTYPVGTTTVVWTITDDSGNETTCEQLITVNDRLPVLTCPANVAEEIAADGCSKSDVTVERPTFTGNCANPVLSYVLTGATEGSGSNYVPADQEFNVGVTIVTYTVTDSHNNTVECSFTVTIRRLNIPPPAINCPANPAPVTALAGTCFADVIVDSPVEVDPCETVTYTFINDHTNTDNASGSYRVGTTVVTWTITDNSGNTITCEQTVTVNDLPPTITCPGPVIAQADFELTYQDAVIVPAPTYGDNCPNPVLTWTLVPPAAYASQYEPAELSGTGIYSSPSLFYLGVTTITYTVTDANGNTDDCSFTVTVLTEPEIACLPGVSYTTDPGVCTATRSSDDYGLPTLEGGLQPITWTWTITNPDGTQGATATFVGSSATPGPPSIPDYAFEQGVSTITWRAQNVSGYDECTQSVTVTDNIDPTFTAPETVIQCVESLFSAVYNPNPTAGIIPEYNDITTPRPEYFLFRQGSTLLDLNAETNNFNDNCCADNSLIIHWRIDFTDTPNPATVAHELIPHASITGTGQPSLYTQNIQFPGDGVYFQGIIHQITYWLVDCNGNPSEEQSVNIIIHPRPNLTKVTD